MASGTVKWFDPKRGYGFIRPEQGEDVFVHVTALEGSGMESLQEGQTVRFDIEQGPRAFRQPTCGRGRPARPSNSSWRSTVVTVAIPRDPISVVAADNAPSP
jgi:cold shock protein